MPAKFHASLFKCEKRRWFGQCLATCVPPQSIWVVYMQLTAWFLTQTLSATITMISRKLQIKNNKHSGNGSKGIEFSVGDLRHRQPNLPFWALAWAATAVFSPKNAHSAANITDRSPVQIKVRVTYFFRLSWPNLPNKKRGWEWS